MDDKSVVCIHCGILVICSKKKKKKGNRQHCRKMDRTRKVHIEYCNTDPERKMLRVLSLSHLVTITNLVV